VQTLRSKIPSLVERLLSGYVNANQESRLKQVTMDYINVYKDTKPQMSSVLVFNRVCRLEIQSVMLVFSTGFVNYCPSNLLSG
jgi:hypothetical protein